MSKPLEIIAGTPDRPLIIPGTDIVLEVYVLEGEQRVLSQGWFAASFTEMLHFLSSDRMKSFISKDLVKALSLPIPFKTPDGGMAYGYISDVLPWICNAVIDAHEAGVLTSRQANLVAQCQALLKGLALVGIDGLIDGITGYQDIRARKALTAILKRVMAIKLQPWTKTFPIEFYKLIFKLKGWPWTGENKRPSVIGRYTNDIVYERLAPGVLEELKRLNPKDQAGKPMPTHHQWFAPDFGHPKLKEHLAGVMALMRASANWQGFVRSLQRAYPKTSEQGDFALD